MSNVVFQILSKCARHGWVRCPDIHRGIPSSSGQSGEVLILFIYASKSTEAFQEGKQSWVGDAAIKESDAVTRDHAGFDHGWSQEVRTSNHQKVSGRRRGYKASRV